MPDSDSRPPVLDYRAAEPSSFRRHMKRVGAGVLGVLSGIYHLPRPILWAFLVISSVGLALTLPRMVIQHMELARQHKERQLLQAQLIDYHENLNPLNLLEGLRLVQSSNPIEGEVGAVLKIDGSNTGIRAHSLDGQLTGFEQEMAFWIDAADRPAGPRVYRAWAVAFHLAHEIARQFPDQKPQVFIVQPRWHDGEWVNADAMVRFPHGVTTISVCFLAERSQPDRLTDRLVVHIHRHHYLPPYPTWSRSLPYDSPDRYWNTRLWSARE